MTAARVERKYVLTKVGKGDYLLPSNDGSTLWRICIGTEDIDGYRSEDVWQAWRMPANRAKVLAEHGDLLDWGEWGLDENWCKTRDEAIQAALRRTS